MKTWFVEMTGNYSHGVCVVAAPTADRAKAVANAHAVAAQGKNIGDQLQEADEVRALPATALRARACVLDSYFYVE